MRKQENKVLKATPINRMFLQFEEIAEKHGYEIYEDPDGHWYIVNDRKAWAARSEDVYDGTPFCGFDYDPEEDEFNGMIWGKIPDEQEKCYREICKAIKDELGVTVYTDIF